MQAFQISHISPGRCHKKVKKLFLHPTVKLSATSLAFLLAATSHRGAIGFRVSPDANNDVMKKAVADLLMDKVKPLQQLGEEEAPPLRNEICGTETPCMYEYWSRPDIHTFGNMGVGGGFHAAMAPLATHIIDVKAYGGVDVRKNLSKKGLFMLLILSFGILWLAAHHSELVQLSQIAQELQKLVNKTNARVVDLCCGVGMSTRALESAFHDAELLVGMDTSNQMISIAKAISGPQQGLRLGLLRQGEALKKILKEGSNAIAEALGVIDTCPYPTSRLTAKASYRLGNAENTNLPGLSFDLVTIMYGFHEVPMAARARIIKEAKRLLRQGGHLAIIDICPTYTPSAYMLAGEPFVKEYQQNIDRQLAKFPGFRFLKRKVVVPGHVNMWLLKA